MTIRHLSKIRKSLTHKAVIHSEKGKVKFYITVGLFEDGAPGELFLTFDESGSTLDGFAKCWAIAVSMLLRREVAVREILDKFGYQKFEPSGLTENDEIKIAQSVVDYVARWMAKTFEEKK